MTLLKVVNIYNGGLWETFLSFDEFSSNLTTKYDPFAPNIEAIKMIKISPKYQKIVNQTIELYCAHPSNYSLTKVCEGVFCLFLRNSQVWIENSGLF